MATKTTPRSGYSLLRLFIVLAVLAVVFSGCYYVNTYWIDPSRRSEEIHQVIQSLENQRPADMTQVEWEAAARWTALLHGNSMLAFYADRKTIIRFQKELDDRIAQGVDFDTILWIWDRYGKLPGSGRKYNQKYRSAMLRAAGKNEQVGETPTTNPKGTVAPSTP